MAKDNERVLFSWKIAFNYSSNLIGWLFIGIWRHSTRSCHGIRPFCFYSLLAARKFKLRNTGTVKVRCKKICFICRSALQCTSSSFVVCLPSFQQWLRWAPQTNKHTNKRTNRNNYNNFVICACHFIKWLHFHFSLSHSSGNQRTSDLPRLCFSRR